ncbi:thiamine-binding protein [Pseudokineococcus basanitobsidens]|uniref:Thiamine-binding protein n=1 Tax=Pseudokineococcus basanitobsidens TaxID=1926649 RepID=A0ABU8RIP7_9ACTN
MLVAFSVAPSGVGDSVAAAVADAVRVVRESGLPHRTDSMFTTVEGGWDEVMDVVRRATEAVGRHGDRVSLVLKADVRTGAAAGRTGEMRGKVDRLEAALAAPAAGSTTASTTASTTGPAEHD